MGASFFNLDPLANYRRTMEATQRALGSTDSVNQILHLTQARVDPMADHRRRMEAVQKAIFPSDSVDRILRFVQPVDPMGTQGIMEQARRVLDPTAEYRQIARSFSALTGVDPSRFPQSVDHESPEGASHPFEPSLALIVNLLGIAWICGWLLARGADVERVGGLMIAAVGLAIYLDDKRHKNSDI